MTPEDEPPQVGRCLICYWQEHRAMTNSSRKNEVAEPKQKRHSVVNMSDGESKIYAVKNNTE